MDLRRIPPEVLLALGLTGCEGIVSACLDVADTGLETTGGQETGQTTTDASSSSGDSGGSASTVGPCLGAPMTTGTDSATGTAGETTVGPCLEPTSGGTGSSAETGTTGADTGTTGSTTSGLASRAAVLDRLCEREVLPQDVVEKLRSGRRGA